MKKGSALAVLKEELTLAGWDNTSAFTVRETAREEARNLAWWHENTPPNESSDTKRNLAYLRAYVRISGGENLVARGIQLDRGRLWMDRSVISRLERDGFLRFVEKPADGYEPRFELTDQGRKWIG
jgi:hypothetical protein